MEGEGAPKKTPLVLLWAFGTVLWSIFTPPHLTFVARVLLFQPLWAMRIFAGDPAWVSDLNLLLGLHFFHSYVTGAWRLPAARDFRWLSLSNHTVLIYIQVFALLGICGFFAGGIVYRGHQLRAAAEREAAASSCEDTIDEQLLPPLLIASRTAHERLVPKRHGFSYSYLLVGIPVGLFGRIGSALSVDSKLRGWFHVDSSDYLVRSGRPLGLAEKLKRYLHSKGITDREYSFAYLVTAPRFMGYNFNPVSFWYLYDSNAKLKFMVLEVNNTFGERRMYLLKLELPALPPAAGGENGPSYACKTLVFTDTWPKDFHVSPFNDRQGTYSLRAIDPLCEYQDRGRVRIDNTIVLRSPESETKIVARVWSEGEPHEAKTISSFQLTRFIAVWSWVGFLTFPRILWEAQRLYLRKKLDVWYRPEVVGTSIGRDYTQDELKLESIFHAWLTEVVEHAQAPLRLIYEPAHHDGDEIVLYSASFTYEEALDVTMTLKVLSPAFYTRFMHYSHAAEALDREYITTHVANRTILIENETVIPVLLDAIKADNISRRATLTNSNIRNPEPLRWTIQTRLRCPPAPQSYYTSSSPHHNSHDLHHKTDIRSFPASELDYFARTVPISTLSGSTISPSEYRKLTTRLFLAQRFALGIPALVAGADTLLRIAMLLATMLFCRNLLAGDVLRPREMGAKDFWDCAVALSLANAVHLYSFVKG